MRDVRGIYNAVVVLADAGRLDLAQEVFNLADEQRVPVEIKGGTHLARLAAEDAIEQAIARCVVAMHLGDEVEVPSELVGVRS
jgi:hypothetical protein